MDEKEVTKVTEGEQPKEEKTPSVEELQAQLAALQNELDSVKQKSSQAITKANSESSEWKKRYRETLDEATRKEQERTEREETIARELAEYKAKDRISTYTTKLVEAGYDLDTAKAMAADLPEGVADSFFSSQKDFLEKHTQTVKSQMLNSQPGPSVGMPPTTKDVSSEADAKFRKWMGL